MKTQAMEETDCMLLCIGQKGNLKCALTPNKKINLMVAISKLFDLNIM